MRTFDQLILATMGYCFVLCSSAVLFAVVLPIYHPGIEPKFDGSLDEQRVVLQHHVEAFVVMMFLNKVTNVMQPRSSNIAAGAFQGVGVYLIIIVVLLVNGDLDLFHGLQQGELLQLHHHVVVYFGVSTSKPILSKLQINWGGNTHIIDLNLAFIL